MDDTSPRPLLTWSWNIWDVNPVESVSGAVINVPVESRTSRLCLTSCRCLKAAETKIISQVIHLLFGLFWSVCVQDCAETVEPAGDRPPGDLKLHLFRTRSELYSLFLPSWEISHWRETSNSDAVEKVKLHFQDISFVTSTHLSPWFNIMLVPVRF